MTWPKRIVSLLGVSHFLEPSQRPQGPVNINVFSFFFFDSLLLRVRRSANYYSVVVLYIFVFLHHSPHFNYSNFPLRQKAIRITTRPYLLQSSLRKNKNTMVTSGYPKSPTIRHLHFLSWNFLIRPHKVIGSSSQTNC